MPSRRLLQEKDADLLVSSPLASMQELKEWEPTKASDVANIASVKLRHRNLNGAVEPKLLLCHDMAGGYKEDQWIQGNPYDTIYNIQYWQYVDSFIYFSHARVTIPPVNWINACHRNGVPCLGTFIVEGDQSSELEMLLHGPTPVRDDDPMRLWNPYFADKLVAIAKHYGFDGWLMNIECSFVPFPTPIQIKTQQLTCFLDYFRTKLHNDIPGSSLIWYDSLTIDGVIDWQNQLNDKNLDFFKVNDGIFLNYWWKDNYPAEASALATTLGRSGTDVYFGTDVWGRGTHGGGEFQSYKGVEDAAKGNASAALFGMAWTYEYFAKQNFDTMDRLFWKGGLASEFPTLHDEKEENKQDHHPGVGKTVRPFPSTSWFSSCFDRGYGTKFYHHGKTLLDEPWSHLSHQDCPPTLSPLATVDGTDAYNGGSSLLVHSPANDNTANPPVMIYSLSLDIQPNTTMQLTYAYKPTQEMSDVKCVLLERIVVDGASEIHRSHTIAKDASISILRSTTQPMANGWLVETIDLRFADNVARNIEQLGFMVSAQVRLGLVSLAPLTEVVEVTHRFHWKNVHWDAMCFWGTLDWHWMNNRKGDELRRDQLEQQNKGPEWCHTDYAVVYLTSDDNQDLFLGTSFSSVFRISGADLGAHNRVKVNMVDALGRIQSSHTIDLPSISYYR